MYDIEGMSDLEEVSLETPFGKPSDTIMVGTLSGVRVAFLPRHGRGHRISPSELPARANVWAMKALGVTHLLSISGLHVTALIGGAYLLALRLLALWPWLVLRVRLPLLAAGVGAGP